MKLEVVVLGVSDVDRAKASTKISAGAAVKKACQHPKTILCNRR